MLIHDEEDEDMINLSEGEVGVSVAVITIMHVKGPSIGAEVGARSPVWIF